MKVALVVEPSYDELASLASKMPVWIVESSENKSSATTLRARKSEAPTYLTTFKVQDVSQRQENCINIVDVIELHHPENERTPRDRSGRRRKRPTTIFEFGLCTGKRERRHNSPQNF
jgi:hypothetical protein